MKLETYLQRENLSASQFSKQLGRPSSTVTRLLHGQRNPGPELMLQILAATKGAVTPNDFLDVETSLRSEGEAA